MIDNSILEQWVNATNEYAALKASANHWRYNLTSAELKMFIAVILFLGVVKWPGRMDAWSDKTILGNPWLRSVVTLSRFKD